MLLQTTVLSNHLASPRKQKKVLQNLRAAAAAAEEGAERVGRRLGPGGTGDCLRGNFGLLAQIVQSQDGHLLSAEEHSRLACFQVRKCYCF